MSGYARPPSRRFPHRRPPPVPGVGAGPGPGAGAQQQQAPAVQPVARPLTGDDARAAAAMQWLLSAVALLNPARAPHRCVSEGELRRFLSLSPPPPPRLQELWAARVWAQPGEPFPAYLLRCLHHHHAVTLLAPRFAVGPSDSAADSGGGAAHDAQEEEGAAAATSAPGPAGRVSYGACVAGGGGRAALQAATLMVVGLRLRPASAELRQVGWEPRPCPHCPRARVGGFAAAALLFAGEACAACGQPFPLAPCWERRTHVVVVPSAGGQGGGGAVAAEAVVLGDAAAAVAVPGATLRALTYASAGDDGRELLVIHSAAPAAAARVAPSGSWRRGVAPRVGLAELAAAVAPSVVGQPRAKRLVALALVHTLYRAARAPAGWRPLHVLLLGPAQSGKTALLQGACALYGGRAQAVGRTIVHRGRRGSGGGVAAALPALAGDVLAGGAAVTAAALVLDDVGGAAPRDAQALRHLLRDGVCAAPAGGTLRARVQVLAAAAEDSRGALAAHGAFPLLAEVQPRLSLRDSAAIGYDVVSTSVARASRSHSRTLSRSSGAASESPQRGSQPSAPGGAVAAEALERLVTAAPGEAALLASLPPPTHFRRYYLQRMMAEAPLLAAAAGAAGVCRPTSWRRGAAPPAAAAAPLMTAACERHLATLAGLAAAWVLLAGPGDGAWGAAAAEEVWDCFRGHLVAAARMAERARLAGLLRDGLPPPPGTPQLDGGGAGAPPASPLGLGAPKAGGGGAGPRGSRKRCRLLLLDAVRRAAGAAGGVVPGARVEALYAELGGAATMGDPPDVVVAQLQQEGLLLRRPGGWAAPLGL